MIHLIDFDHYLQAARMLWEGLSPYGKVEFFAPPWMALLIGPLLLLPAKVAQIIWMLANILAVNISALVSLQWLKPIPLERWKSIILILLVGFLPSALFSYITGQISPLVALAALLMAKEISSQRSRPLVFILGILLVSLKPHIVLLPILLLMLELIRQKKLVIVLWCGIGLLIVALFGFLIDPQWPVELVKSWASGDFRGGKPGLVSPGYIGLSDFGIRTWMFAGFVMYTLNIWYQDGLTFDSFSLSLGVNLLLLPYRRSYDDVILVFPLLNLLLNQRANNKLGIAAAVTGLFVIPWTVASFLSPVFLVLGTLLKRLTHNKALS